MAKYSILKRERDDAVERAVIAERNSQLERVRDLESAHAAELTELRNQIRSLGAALTDARRSFAAAAEGATRMLFESLGTNAKADDGNGSGLFDPMDDTHPDLLAPDRNR